MWVFDGEEWTQDDGGVEPRARQTEPSRPRYDDAMPELQVVEIVPVSQPQRRREIPPLPMP